MMEIRRALEILRWEGADSLLVRALRKALGPVLRIERVRFFESDLARPLPSIPARVPLAYRTVSRTDLSTFVDSFARFGVGIEDAKERLDLGDVAVVALAHDQVACLSWLTTRPAWVDEAAVWLRLGPGEATGYAGGTLPAWRGYGIAPSLWRWAEQWLHANGFLRVIEWIRADNVQSLKTTLRLGRRPTRTVWTVWALGMSRPLALGLGDGQRSPALFRTPPIGPPLAGAPTKGPSA